ncbi:hypothetical protein RDI58_006803 [Solanum bulbocastanum]|uniref:AT hook motif-containing protein n=1 Tax=Solanum bulbocastanum TaxID=147425 RepID=A0AAN8TU95_SOLBU
MNDQTKQENPSAPAILPEKRRRGRARKDEGPAKRMILQTPPTPAPEIMRQKDITTDENMLGQIVSGVIDGTFDAGYFLSVKLGNNATTLRGLIFEPGRFSPITAANDIAPQVKMHHRSQVITLQDQENGSTNEQLNVPPEQVLLPSDHPLVRNDQRANPDETIKHQPQFTPLLENLRMVEQDEVMEVFEVANQSGLELNVEQGKCTNGHKSTQSQLIDSNSIIQSGTLVCSDLNSLDDEIHHNNVVDGSQEMGSDQKQIEAEVEKNKSDLETLLQPAELVHCELKKLEIHRAPPIDAQTQLIATINPELQPKELTQSGQGNQDFQPHQTPSFVELNFLAQESVAAESEVKPSDSIHNELHFVDMPQHYVTSDTQVIPQESISELYDPKEKQSTDVGTEVEFVGKEQT